MRIAGFVLASAVLIAFAVRSATAAPEDVTSSQGASTSAAASPASPYEPTDDWLMRGNRATFGAIRRRLGIGPRGFAGPGPVLVGRPVARKPAGPVASANGGPSGANAKSSCETATTVKSQDCAHSSPAEETAKLDTPTPSRRIRLNLGSIRAGSSAAVPAVQAQRAAPPPTTSILPDIQIQSQQTSGRRGSQQRTTSLDLVLGRF
jgi:hypothetical protein